MTKSFKIGEYAIGGIIRVERNKDVITVEALDYVSKQTIMEDRFHTERSGFLNQIDHFLHELTTTIKNRDKKLTELTEDDWDISELANPYGAYRIEIKEAIGSHCGCLKSAEEFEELKTLMAEDIDKMEQFELSQFIDGKIVITDILEQLKNNSNG